MHISWTPQVFGGVGILTSIFCPIRVDLKFDLTMTFTSILPLPVSLTSGMTLNGRLMSLVVLYFINFYKKQKNPLKVLVSTVELEGIWFTSNSPSGGIKLILWSDSNLLNLTHWWNWMSSMAIDDLPLVVVVLVITPATLSDTFLEPLLSSVNLSLMPNLHSGMPLK